MFVHSQYDENDEEKRVSRYPQVEPPPQLMDTPDQVLRAGPSSQSTSIVVTPLLINR